MHFTRKDIRYISIKMRQPREEFDVMIQKDGVVVPIEVKSENTRLIPLKSILKMNADIPLGYKFVDGNIGCK